MAKKKPATPKQIIVNDEFTKFLKQSCEANKTNAGLHGVKYAEQEQFSDRIEALKSKSVAEAYSVVLSAYVKFKSEQTLPTIGE